MGRPEFQNWPLGDMVAVGSVGPDRARIWLRADRLGNYRLQWSRIDDFHNQFQTMIGIADDNGRDDSRVVDIPLAEQYQLIVRRPAWQSPSHCNA